MLFYPLKMIAENLKSVTQRISRACEKSGRSQDSVRLVCVTKGLAASAIEEVLGLGQHEIGENRVQELVSKHGIIGDRATWHLIGHLQTNKARDAVRIASLIHSIDSVRLAKEIDSHAREAGKVQDILIEVNTSGEASKFGIQPAETIDFIKNIVLYPNLNIIGLMTMAPEVEDPEAARPCFKRLRELRDEINKARCTKDDLSILSMGMSNDFEVAIEEGSNMVRVGRAIFSKPCPLTLAP